MEVPALRGRINDLAGLLSAVEREQLESQLAAFETETSHQVVVLTVPTLDGEDVAAFAIRVADAWKIGHGGLDNGVVIVVADRDRKARIEVGYGLEGTVPDAIAARILREQMIPSFRAGNMGEGIVRGAQAIMQVARGEEISRDKWPVQDAEAPSDPFEVVLFCGFFGGIVGASLSRRSRIAGAAIGAIVSFAMSFLILQILGYAGGASLFGGLVGAFAGGSSGAPGHGRRVIRTLPGGWGGGGFGGGGFGGAGGGFGGGGGGFGGGGASGSW